MQSGYSPSNRSTLTYNDIDGTCRQIVEKLSEMDCGTFHISSGNTLGFLSAVSNTGTLVIYDDDECTPYIEESSRQITGAVITDTHDNKVYTYGSSDYRNIAILSGDYIDQSAATSIAGMLFNSGQGSFRYYAFAIQNAIMHDFAKAGCKIQIGLGQDGTILPCRADSVTIRFGAINAIGTLSAPIVYEGYAAYMNAINRKDKDSVKKNATHNTYFVNNSGDGRRVKI